MLALDLIKDVYSDIDISIRARVSRRNRKESTISFLRNEGVCVSNSLISPTNCFLMRNELDELLQDKHCKVWKDDLGSDNRIYGFENVSVTMKNIIDVSEARIIGEDYLGRPITHYFAMAARLDSIVGNKGSGGGWHRDSAFSHQFKSIFYLSDVSEDNGPFQYVVGSHTTRSKWNDFQIYNSNRTRFEDNEVIQINSKIKTLVGAEGTTLYADTRGVHRGKPISSGARYALFLYFFTKHPPLHFKKYLQGSISTIKR